MSEQRIVCPLHGIPDCSPMLNGCNLVIKAHREADSNGSMTAELDPTTEVEELARIRAVYARGTATEHDRTWQSGADEFDDWLKKRDAETWQEGWNQGFRDYQAHTVDQDGYLVITPTPNPYQQHKRDWSDWGIDHPEETATCSCGYNGTFEECEASRAVRVRKDEEQSNG